MVAPRAPVVLVDLQPTMYAEVLAFALRKRRPRAEVSLLGPSEALEAEARRLGPHLIVANLVPRAARTRAFWVEVARPVGGERPKTLGAEISANGYSRSVGDVRIEDVLKALDLAEEELLPGRSRARGEAQRGEGS